MRNSATIGKRVGYGWLYNFYAVETGTLAPTGWRVPTQTEVVDLINHLPGGTGGAGRLKSTREEWKRPNTSATNEYLFSALPAGQRFGVFGEFIELREYAHFWASTPYSTNSGRIYNLHYNSGTISTSYTNKYVGRSVRCIQDKGSGESNGDMGTLTDIDGNVYGWIVIGDYRWMTENLRTKHLNTGVYIVERPMAADWVSIENTARCAYNNDHYLVYPPGKNI